MAQSKTVILELEGIAEQIREAIAESEIPEGERGPDKAAGAA